MSTTPAPSKIDALPVAGELLAAPIESYPAADQAFFRFWYGHMLDDLMQPPLAGTSHSTARYIWDAALAPTTPVPAEPPCPTCNGSTYVITGLGEFAGGDECPQCVGGVELGSADPLTLAILKGLTYAELHEKAVYLMELNANQARTIDELQLAATPAQQTQSDAVAGAAENELVKAWASTDISTLESMAEEDRKRRNYDQFSSNFVIGFRAGALAARRRLTATPPQQATPTDYRAPEGVQAWLFEHDDGRQRVAFGDGSPAFTVGDPAWHRVGPVEMESQQLLGDSAQAFLDLARLYCAVTETPSGGLEWSFDQSEMENLAAEVVAQHQQARPSAAASIKPDVQGTPTIASTAPERIWLDLGEGVDRHEPGVHFRECHEVTWSEDNATCNGIEYVRAALKEAPGGGT